jgi:hypothetical protein
MGVCCPQQSKFMFTPQIKLVALGTAGFAVAKLYFKKDVMTAALAGLAVISAVAVLTAHDDKKER